MGDLPAADAIVYTTHLRPCSRCGHPRGDHPEDRRCSIKGYPCARFRD